METELLVWQISLIALTAGVLIGALGYRLFAPSRKHAEEVEAELDKAREELDEYKADVSQHFDRTAELVNDLAQKYVNVYQHLADGAQTLGASRSFKELYGQGQGNPAIGVDDRSDTAEAIDQHASTAPDQEVDTSPSPDEQTTSPEKSVEDAESSAEKVDEKLEATGSGENAAEPEVSKSTDDNAGAGRSAQDSETPEKARKH